MARPTPLGSVASWLQDSVAEGQVCPEAEVHLFNGGLGTGRYALSGFFLKYSQWVVRGCLPQGQASDGLGRLDRRAGQPPESPSGCRTGTICALIRTQRPSLPRVILFSAFGPLASHDEPDDSVLYATDVSGRLQVELDSVVDVRADRPAVSDNALDDDSRVEAG